MTRYFLYFAIAYFILLIVTAIILTMLDIDVSSTIPVLMASGVATAINFVNREKRIPTSSEKTKLIWGTNVISIIISAILTFLYFFIMDDTSNYQQILEMAQSLGLFLVIILIVVFLLQATVLYFCFGWYANLVYKKQNK